MKWARKELSPTQVQSLHPIWFSNPTRMISEHRVRSTPLYNPKSKQIRKIPRGTETQWATKKAKKEYAEKRDQDRGNKA